MVQECPLPSPELFWYTIALIWSQIFVSQPSQSVNKYITFHKQTGYKNKKHINKGGGGYHDYKSLLNWD